jgi:hypothetical protein
MFPQLAPEIMKPSYSGLAPAGNPSDQAAWILPAAEIPGERDDRTVLGLAELLLKDPARVDSLTRVEARQAILLPRLLMIGLASFSLFALALALLFSRADTQELPAFMAGRWSAHPLASAAAMWLAYVLGFVLASCVCLPSFYFYGLLSGVKITMLQVTALIMKSKASTGMMLLGILPIYLAAALGGVIFHVRTDYLQAILYLGLILPFIAGLWGVSSLYRGFTGLADTLPPERQCRRGCFLRRLTAACSACYTAVAPVMIYTLWNYFVAALT